MSFKYAHLTWTYWHACAPVPRRCVCLCWEHSGYCISLGRFSADGRVNSLASIYLSSLTQSKHDVNCLYFCKDILNYAAAECDCKYALYVYKARGSGYLLKGLRKPEVRREIGGSHVGEYEDV